MIDIHGNPINIGYVVHDDTGERMFVSSFGQRDMRLKPSPESEDESIAVSQHEVSSGRQPWRMEPQPEPAPPEEEQPGYDAP